MQFKKAKTDFVSFRKCCKEKEKDEVMQTVKDCTILLNIGMIITNAQNFRKPFKLTIPFLLILLTDPN